MLDIEDGVTLVEYETMPLAEFVEPTQHCSCMRRTISSPLFCSISLIFCLLIFSLIFGIMSFKYTSV